MDLSIVSGTYNRLPYLQRMVESVRVSFIGVYGLEYEIVLVDGGSQDTTQEWCKQQPDIKLIEHNELRGAVKAFNDGAFAATGKYVVMGNDDIEFVGNGLLVALVYMETHPNCGGGAFYQNREGRDWHINGMPAVQVISRGKGKQIHVPYAQVGIFPKWLGDLVHWWCDDDEFGRYLSHEDYRKIGDGLIGLHTYGGDNELSARIVDLGFTIDPIPGARISDSEAKDELRRINNIESGHDPKSVNGHHPDSWKWGKKWFRRNERLGYRNLAGPIIKDKPMIRNPITESTKERVLYLPIYEQGWQVQKEQKRGLRESLAKKAIVYEYDYMRAYAGSGKAGLISDLERICNEFRPTIFLSQFHNTDIFTANDIMNLKQICGLACRFVNWNGDYWPEQCLTQSAIELAKTYGLMTHVNGAVIKAYKEKGISAAYWQIGWEPEGRGYEPDIFHDVVFLASGYSQKRQALGAFLQKQQRLKVGIYGNGWPNGMSKGENLYNFSAACKIYRGAKIAIGDAQWGHEAEGYVSNRLFQILAAGNCVLCHQYFEGYETLGLHDQENCLIWRDLDDLQSILRFWLSDTAKTRLAQIAANGEALALERHSFDSRVGELWQLLGIERQEDVVIWRW